MGKAGADTSVLGHHFLTWRDRARLSVEVSAQRVSSGLFEAPSV